MEVKDGLIDEAASKTSTLERDIKRLNKEAEYLRGSDNRCVSRTGQPLIRVRLFRGMTHILVLK